MKKRIYYVVGITVADTDLYYPIMNMLSGFLSSEYAHNYRMYAHGNSYKMITDPVNDRLFAGNPDGRYVHMFMIEGSETFIACMKKYLFEGKAWERWDVTPYFEFVKGEDNQIVPVEWFNDAFKQFLGF